MKSRIYVRKKKDLPCLDCGNRFDYPYMSFDHIRGDKLFSLGSLPHLEISRRKIDKEISKCEVVCLVCHRKREIKRLRNGVFSWIMFMVFGYAGKPIQMVRTTR